MWKIEENEKNKGFHQKIWNLVQTIMLANSKIAEKLVFDRIKT